MLGGQDDNDYGPQLVAACRPPSMIIADDLTGACDAAVAFTSAYDPIVVELLNKPVRTGAIHVITTESRDLPAEQAELRVRRLVERLSSDTQILKKIDSVFRGNTVQEVSAALRYAHFDLAILAPAYPGLGRTVRQGTLYINDACGTRTMPIADSLATAGCSLAVLTAKASPDEMTASLRRLMEDGMRAVLCDASTQEDLVHIVRAARSLSERILWIGSGGLAHALAADLPNTSTRPDTAPRTGSTIFFIGSPHPVSRAQVDHLRQIARIAEHHSDATYSAEEDLLVEIELGRTTPEEVRRAVASHDPARVGCLFMTGGETAYFICGALGIHSLRLLHEFAPGVPHAVAEGGPFDGVHVALKSGGFGERDLLCRLLETHRATPEVIA